MQVVIDTNVLISAFYALSVTETSDKRLKTNVEPLKNSLNKVMQLQGVSYNWKADPKNKKRMIGFLAQDVEKVIPEVVTEKDNGYKGLKYGHLTAILLEAIKEQQNIISNQKEKINSLINTQSGLLKTTAELEDKFNNIENSLKNLKNIKEAKFSDI